MPYLERDITDLSYDLCTGGKEGHTTRQKVSDEIFLLMGFVVRHGVLAQMRYEEQSRTLTEEILERVACTISLTVPKDVFK